MSSVAAAEPERDQPDGHVTKLLFFLFVFGATLLCVGVLLSVFGYQACPYKPAPTCSAALRAAGPACAAVGLALAVLARSRARLRLRAGRRGGARAFACGESRQFAQCLTFGFLFLTSGLLISILGIWVPGCGSDWVPEPLNDTDTAGAEPPICGFLSLQITGPLVVLAGLCFFVVAHVKKRSGSSAHGGPVEGAEAPAQGPEPVQVTVGDSVIIFPPPPPPYFPESSASAATRSPGAHSVLPSENPPSYYSLFHHRTPTPESEGAAPAAGPEAVFTISGARALSEASPPPHLAPDSPPDVRRRKPPRTPPRPRPPHLLHRDPWEPVALYITDHCGI